ncbi:MAG: hypothetical protein KDH20_08555 [Rhodocyclaceae bacterium]|nr:hypothetical protein [Rhodocyclaceae bacterium]
MALATLMSAPLRAEPIDFRPGFKVGETFRWSYREESTRQRRGKPPDASGTVTPLTARVLEASSSGYVLDWHIGEAQQIYPDQTESSGRSEDRWLQEVATTLNFELQLSREGRFLALRNHDPLRSKIDAVIERLVVERRARGANVAEEAGRVLREMLADRERFEAFLLQDILLLLFPMGISLDTDAATTTQAELPNPFGGDALLSDVAIRVAAIDLSKDRAIVEVARRLEPGSVTKLLQAMMARAGKRGARAAEFAHMTADITDTGKIEVERSTGLVWRASHTRQITLPGMVRTIRREFERIE